MQAIADSEGARHHHRALGLPLLRREGPQGEVRPRRERGEALPPAREAARGRCSGSAGQLFGLHFTPVDRACRSTTPTSRVWEVKDGAGKHVGPLVLRPLRPARQALRRLDERLPDAGAVRRRGHHHRLQQLQLREGPPGEPVLICWDDAETLFHEFGHALHGLLLQRHLPVALRHRRGPRLRRVPLADPGALALDARGAQPLRACTTRPASPCPQTLVAEDREGADSFNQGFATVEYLSAALVDMKLHLAGGRRSTRPPSSARRWPRSACRARSSCATACRSSPRLLERRLLGRLLQLPLGRHPERRRLRGLHRGQGALRQGGGGARCEEVRLLGRQHGRSGRGLPGLPRPRRRRRGPHAQARLPGPAARHRRPAGLTQPSCLATGRRP